MLKGLMFNIQVSMFNEYEKCIQYSMHCLIDHSLTLLTIDG